MTLPEYARKMRRFFELAFQQTQITSNDFADQVFAQVGRNAHTTPLLLQNVQESFARTMVELTAQGHPLTEAMTTRQLMMTTAIKELYAFLDTIEIDNEGKIRSLPRAAPQRAHRGRSGPGPHPPGRDARSRSPNYMHWYDPDVATA